MSHDLFAADRAETLFDVLAREATQGAASAWLRAVDQRVVTTMEDLRDMVQDLLGAPHIAFDIETTGLNIIDDRVVALQFCGRPDRAYFIPVGMLGVENLGLHAVVVACRPLWERGLIGHNISFDWQFMQRWVDFKVVADTVLEAKLVPELWVTFERDWSLKNIGATLFQRETIEFKHLFPRGTKDHAKRFDLVPMELAVPYACQDVVLTWMLHETLHRDHGLTANTLIYQLEHEIIKPVARMELLGVGIDEVAIQAGMQAAEAQMAEDFAQIQRIAGRDINLNATRDMAWLLYEHCGLAIPSRTSTGLPSTDKATLEKLAGQHEVVDCILHYRGTSKLAQAFLAPLPGMRASDGRVHTSYNQYGAITGRFSSSKPNLQQIPKPKDTDDDVDALRMAIRRSIIPGDGFIGFLDIDYSQVEYRLFASLAKELPLMEAFLNGIDVHKKTGALMFRIPVDEVTKEQRGKGKTANFAAIYGQHVKALADAWKISVGEAERIMRDYWAAIPNAARYCEQLRQEARATGYATTYFGRRRYVPEIHSTNKWERMQGERYAVNAPIQGMAADLVKMAIARVASVLSGAKSRLSLTVHDQLVIAHHESDPLDELAEAVREAMEIPLPGFVPLETEAGYGPNWSDTDKYIYPSRRPDRPRPVVVGALPADPAPVETGAGAGGVGDDGHGEPPLADSAGAVAEPAGTPGSLQSGMAGLHPAVPAGGDPDQAPLPPAPYVAGADAGTVTSGGTTGGGGASPAGSSLPRDYLRLVVTSTTSRDLLQTVRTLLAIHPGATPVVISVNGADTVTPTQAHVTPPLLLKLRQLGMRYTLGVETTGALRQTIAMGQTPGASAA